MTGIKGPHFAVNGSRAPHVTEGEIVVHGPVVARELVVGKKQDGLQLGSEGQAAILLGNIERFDAERVAGERQRPLAPPARAAVNMPSSLTQASFPHLENAARIVSVSEWSVRNG